MTKSTMSSEDSKKLSTSKEKQEIVWKRFWQVCKPVTRLTGSEWADRYRKIPLSTSAEPGRWRTSRTPYLKEPMDSATDRYSEKVVMMFSSQVGKALALDTPLPTPEGWTTMGEAKVGGTLFDENGRPCRILAKTEVMTNHKCFRVKFSDGSEIVADADHVWRVCCDTIYLKDGRIKWVSDKEGELVKEYTTAELAEIQAYEKLKNRHAFAIPVAKPLNLPKKDLLIAPYTLGVWLGDGHAYSNQFCGHISDLEIVDGIREEGYNAIIEPQKKDTERCIRGHLFSEVGLTKDGYCAQCARQYALKHKWKDPSRLDPVVNREQGFYSKLKALNVLKNKHIPKEYLRASEEQRWKLLQGLMDTDGHSTPKGVCKITLRSERLIEGVKELLLSLGLKPTVHKKKATIKDRGFSCMVTRLTFVAYADQPVFRLRRKQGRLKKREDGRLGETTRRRILAFEPIESVPVQCIAVDSESHLYLAGRNMIPTHNSETLLNLIGYFADQEPAPQLMLQPTVEMAEAFSKERIAPMFRESSGLSGKLEEGKDGKGSEKKASTTILMKHYPGGYLAMVGANSPAGLASRPIRVLLADEVDRYPLSAGKEGDPIKLAIQRTANFANRKIVLVSTPTIKGVSKIEREFSGGDQREFFVECPECREKHVLKWENVRWEKDEKGNVIEDSVGMYCPECGSKIRGSGRIDPKILSTGEWRPQNPAGKYRSYHLNALYSPWVVLSDLVFEWSDINKRRDKDGLMEFVNLKLGEPWEQYAGEADLWEYLLKRREYYPEGVLPDGVLLLTAGVDVQRDRLECTVYGWGLGRECWGIFHKVVPGVPDDPDTWRQLDGILWSQFRLSNGSAVNISCCLVDSGDGTYTKSVYEYTRMRERNRIFSCKGRGGQGVPFIGTPSKSNLIGATLYTLGVDSGKTAVVGRLAIASEGAGFVHYPMKEEAGFNENFFKQLTAEVWESKYEKGKVTAGWKKIRERNEALDCAVYATAAMELLSPNFEMIQQYMQGGAVQQTAPVRKHRVSGFGET